MKKTIAFRVDGNSKMGTGHLARCRVLAEACLKRGSRVLWMTADAEGKKFAPRARTVRIADTKSNRRHAAQIRRALKPGDVVVLDGYHFGEALERELRQAGLKVAILDDNAERPFKADWVLNGNVHARQLRYRGARGTKFALGPRYFIFSDEVRKARRKRIATLHARRILVTMGGADPSNQTLKVLRAMDRAGLGLISVTVVAGAANRNFLKLRKFASRCSYPCRILRSTDQMGKLMTLADVGISSAGRVASEMAFLGLPSLKIVLAENQLGLVTELHRRGAAINLGRHARLTAKRIAVRLRNLMDDVALRRKMSDKGRRIFDSKGTERVVQILASL